MAGPFKRGDRVVGYCRYSEGDDQGMKNVSTEEQAAAIRDYCDAEGLTLVRIFADPFASGRSVVKRDSYLEMLSFLLHRKKPDVQGVVLWDFERYGRNYDQAQLDAARLRMAGYKLFSLQQPIVDDGPFSHVLEAMYFASAQNQSDMISADVRRALQSNFVNHRVIPRSSIGWAWKPEPVAMGTFADGSERVGYRAVPDPEKAELIRAAVRARMAGASTARCREILGIKANKSVKHLFANPLLYGCMTYGGTVMEDYCDPIIDRATFDALRLYEQAHPGKQVGRQGGWSADPPMLSGLLFCAHCGGPIYIIRRKSKGRIYASYYCEAGCFPGLHQAELEDFIIALCGEILSPANLRRWIESLSENEAAAGIAEQRQAAEDDLKACERKIAGVMDLLIDHPSAILAVRIQKMETERDALRRRLIELTQVHADGLDPAALYNSTLELSEAVLRVLRADDAPASAKRSALASFIHSIVIDRAGNVVVNYMPPGYSCNPTGPRPENKKAEDGSVVGHPRSILPAPPGVGRFGLQFRGVFLRTRKPRTRRRR